MGAIASLLLDKGARVSGSDIKEGRITRMLRAKGATVRIGHDARHVTSPDFVVYSSAISPSNPELAKARAKGLRILQRAQMLAMLMQGYTNITVAGAHGKTTTTSMVSKMMVDAQLHPTTALGGIIEEALYDTQLGEGKYFVSEVDESDGSFLYFHPDYSIITNIDFEHIDYYRGWENIVKTYQTFIENTRGGGMLFGFGEDARLRKLLKESGKPYMTYGFDAGNDLQAMAVESDHFRSRFKCVYQGNELGYVTLNVPGQHNIADALACILLGLHLSIDFHVICASLKEYKPVHRRFQLVGETDGITVVDDYGHHPTEIKNVLATARAVGQDRLIVVFQPHRYTRLKYLQREFARSLQGADHLIITDVYAASEPPLEGVNAQSLCRLVKTHIGQDVCYLPQEKIVDHLMQVTRPHDLVLTLGAGDITQIAHEFSAALKLRTIAT